MDLISTEGRFMQEIQQHGGGGGEKFKSGIRSSAWAKFWNCAAGNCFKNRLLTFVLETKDARQASIIYNSTGHEHVFPVILVF